MSIGAWEVWDSPGYLPMSILHKIGEWGMFCPSFSALFYYCIHLDRLSYMCILEDHQRDKFRGSINITTYSDVYVASTIGRAEMFFPPRASKFTLNPDTLSQYRVILKIAFTCKKRCSLKNTLGTKKPIAPYSSSIIPVVYFSTLPRV